MLNCKFDKYGNEYCPEALETARDYTSYSQSTVLEKTDTTTDFERGTYKEHTSTVRDFMDGFATSHNANVIDKQTGNGVKNIATVIDYQNGSSIKRSNTVVDYASKENSTGGQEVATYGLKILQKVPCAHCDATSSGTGGNLHIQIKDGEPECLKNFRTSGFCSNVIDITNTNGWEQIGLIRWVTPQDINMIGVFKKVTAISVIKCPEGYSDTTGAETSKGECRKNVAFNFYEYTCPATYTPVNNGFTSYTKTDPNTSAVNWNTLDDDVNSATPPVGNCKKTITYPYYNYNCPSGYTVNDKGLLDACPRTDPNKSVNNEAELSKPCNNATPPAGNCEKIVPYTFYSYECSAGYTAIDKGLATCKKTDSNNTGDNTSELSKPCNNANPPKENCYKDIKYKHYSYGCAEGYVTDNYGLATCEKKDPNKSVNNSETLDDDCNSKLPPEGNCKKTYSYKYYEYLCEGKNAFDQDWVATDKGMTSCTKTDTDKNSINKDLANACNSSTPPKNNCKSTEFTCDSNLFRPVFVDGKWKCSPYLCDGTMKCGYGTCPSGTTPSLDKYMSPAYNPLRYAFSNNCNTPLCDYVFNRDVSYCERKACPVGDDIIEQNGKCYKLECPAGTYLSGDKCITGKY